MGDVAAILPAGFQADPELAKAVGSGVDSVSSGIQSAAQTSGPAEISDWLENFSSSFPPIGTAPAGKAGFADAGAVQSPDAYFANAREAGDVNGFSDLVSIDRVTIQLADSSFDYQKSLQSFADIFRDIELSSPNLAELPTPLEDASARRRVDIDDLSASLEEGSALRRADFEDLPTPIEDASAARLRVDFEEFPTPLEEASTRQRVDIDDLPTPLESKAIIIPDTDFVAGIGLSPESIPDGEVFQRLQYFQRTLQEIVQLNQGK